MTPQNNSQTKFDVDFDQELPVWEFFPVWWLAKTWRCDGKHIVRLIDSGELEVALDIRNKVSSRMMIRVPRKSVVHFLNKRKNLEAVAAGSPKYPTRAELEQRRRTTRRANTLKNGRRASDSASNEKPFYKRVPANCKTTAKIMQRRKEREAHR
jgi:hypothetical protein